MTDTIKPEADQRRDAMLLNALKMPPQPRPKRERGKNALATSPKPHVPPSSKPKAS